MHQKTIERTARIICDIDGPFERSGRELEALLRDAGWADPPSYDGSARIPWLLEAMRERMNDPAAIERLFCQVCNPVEYDDGMASAGVMLQTLNEALALEQLAISFWSGRPVMGSVSPDGHTAVFSAPDELETRLPMLIADPAAIEWLLARVRETRICEENGAFTFALVGIGSFVEYLLLSVLAQWDEDIRVNGFIDDRGRPTRRPSLELLVRTAHEKGWIQLDAKDFLRQVREYRNLVHLRLQSETGLAPDRDTIMMCWAPVRAVLNDLEATVVRLGGLCIS
ncbi:MAG TPA: hypothetical protein VHZ03_22895 [Trebonia sp.]|jgi:hypothetical protein|nr:hypothetical protein [Trebonia sp.]